ncbi:MAG: hypothetical protein IPK87_04465 [Planctomycetes bacterium]|nr:hypothetical protein [Planctomycetota bacterium]
MPVGDVGNLGYENATWGSVTYGYQSSSGLLGKKMPFPDKYRTVTHQVTLRAGLRVIPILDVQLTMPFYSYRNRARDLLDLDLFGQGDAQLFADFFPWRNLEDPPGGDLAGGMFSLRGLGFRGGFKLPTGRAERDLDPSRGPSILMQLGTGTLDFMTGVQFAGHLDGFTIFFRADMQLPLHTNSHGFRPGETFAFATGLGYTFEHIVTPALTISTLHLLRDTLDGKRHPDTGGNFVFVTPSVAVRVIHALTLHASVRFTPAKDSNNPSTGEIYSIGASWFIEF